MPTGECEFRALYQILLWPQLMEMADQADYFLDGEGTHSASQHQSPIVSGPQAPKKMESTSRATHRDKYEGHDERFGFERALVWLPDPAKEHQHSGQYIDTIRPEPLFWHSGLNETPKTAIQRLQPRFIAGSHLVLASPYRGDNVPEDSSDTLTTPQRIFSKKLLVDMDHSIHHLEIDLFRPGTTKKDVFPLQDLSPLCLYRHLRTLKIVGMMESYQWYIWLTVWMNQGLTDLTLEMANQGERLSCELIAEAQKYAHSKPTMHELVHGRETSAILKKLPIVQLRLTNFIIDTQPFMFFSGTRLQAIEFCRCQDAGFRLPEEIHENVKVAVIDERAGKLFGKVLQGEGE